MSLREFGWSVWLAGLPFAPFLFFHKFDLWHAQALWFQVGLGLLAVVGLADPKPSVPNRPLACWTAWVLCLTAGLWSHLMLQTKTYPVVLLLGLGNFLLLPIFYSAFTSFWTPSRLGVLFRVLAWAGAVLVGYGLIQHAQMDPFFRNLDFGSAKEQIVGTVGNPSHFGTFLGLCLPIFLLQPERGWKYVAVIAGLLILLTDSTGAMVATAVGVAFWGWTQHPRSRGVMLAGVLVTLVCAALMSPRFFNDGGRMENWRIYGQYITAQPILGHGPGFIKALSHEITYGPLKHWRHVHCEPLQLLIEQGMVGLAAALWVTGETLKRAWRVRRSPLGACAGAMVLIFLFNSLVSFPAHLALLASLALVAVSTLWVLDGVHDA